jgi:hypothetical protein
MKTFYKPFTMTTNQTLMKMNGIKSAGSNAGFKENIQNSNVEHIGVLLFPHRILQIS